MSQKIQSMSLKFDKKYWKIFKKYFRFWRERGLAMRAHRLHSCSNSKGSARRWPDRRRSQWRKGGSQLSCSRFHVARVGLPSWPTRCAVLCSWPSCSTSSSRRPPSSPGHRRWTLVSPCVSPQRRAPAQHAMQSVCVVVLSTRVMVGDGHPLLPPKWDFSLEICPLLVACFH